MPSLQNAVACSWEPIVQACRETLLQIQGNLDDCSLLILHRSNWQCLAGCHAAVLDALQSRLHRIFTTGRDEQTNLSAQDLVGPLKAIYHAMQEALKSMQDCTKPRGSQLDTYEWLVCKALWLGISTDVVDLHLDDFMWAYATLQLALLHKAKLGCCEQEDILQEELRLLCSIWKGSHEANGNRLADCSLGEEDGSRCHLAARFVRERLAYAEGSQSLSMTRGHEDLPPFLWVGKESFNIVDVLSKGSHGEVHEARFHGIGRFAVKELPYVPGMEVFGTEAAIQARLQHPNVMHLVCCLKDHAQGRNRYSLVTELLKEDLNTLIRERTCQRPKAHPPFTLLQAVDLMLQIAKGMQYLHSRNIVHRDLKSKNILVSFVSPHGPADAPHVKVADFGTSKGKPHADLHFTTTKIGTTAWRAPEVSDRNFTNKADVYSFAMVCFEILTGKEPFQDTKELQRKVLEGKKPTLPSYCPPALASYIAYCWDGNPDARPSFNQICRVLRFLKACIFLSNQPGASAQPYKQCLEHHLSSDISADSMLQAFKSRPGVRLQGPTPLSMPLEMFWCYSLIHTATRYKCQMECMIESWRWLVHTFARKKTPPQGQKSALDGPAGMTPRQFSRKEVVKITNGFRIKIHGCGAKKLYGGKLSDGHTEVLIRPSQQREVVIGSPSRQAHAECNLGAELEVVRQLRHKHIVQLLGWCVHPPELLLVYKSMPYGDLATNLFGSSASPLSFERRCIIIEQVASALDYLHSRVPIVIHRDLKTSNIMLDSKWNSRLGGFNWACALGSSDSFKSDTAMVGTCGYIAPESLKRFIASTKSDVYSFGVVILTVVCGKRAVKEMGTGQLQFLTDEVWDLHLQHRLKDAADARFNLKASCDKTHIERMLMLGLSCTNALPDMRPTMRTVLTVLTERFEPPQPHDQRYL